MSEEVYLTAAGAEKLREELAELTGPRRTDLAKRLRAAIQQGDLSENADYIATKEEQAFLEGRIQEIEAILKIAVIIDDRNRNSDIVEVGARVTIQEEEYPQETYRLVGSNEADSREGRISHESPFGRALMGHKVGDIVIAETPSGSVHIKILKIE
jgi:transcription elongation factor GreA